MRKNPIRKKRRLTSSTAWLCGPILALAERFPRFLDMYRFTENTPLLGLCNSGKAVWRKYEFLCEHHRTSIASTMVPKYDLRLDVSWYLEKKCQREEGCTSPLLAAKKAKLLSIIVPFHNNWNLTCQCIYELVLGSSPYQTEIIIIDDASNAEESGKVRQCVYTMGSQYGTPISVHKNEKSMGFSFSCNKGASISEGFLLLFANNDMFVLNGAIPLLVETLLSNPKIGLVGPMMIDEHRIQEMGGVIFNDGSAANGFRGRKEIPSEWMMTHRVDYVSGACILLEKNLFAALNGFDPIYGRGYYEDTDLAMAVRNHSMEVVIQPLAVVYHQEGNTFGAESAQKQSLMAKNQQLFYEKWRGQLQYHLLPGASPHMAKRRLQRKTILWIDQTIPAPYFDSGSQRTKQILQILQDYGYDVTFLPILKLHHGSWLPAYFSLRFAGVSILENLSPLSICKFRIVFVARPNTLMRVYKMLSECPGTSIIYDTVDLHFVRLARHIFQSHKSLNKPTLENLVSVAKCGSSTAISDLSDDERRSKVFVCIAKRGIAFSSIDENFLAQVVEAGTMFTWEVAKAQIAKQILVISKTEYNLLLQLGIHEKKLANVSNIYDDYLFTRGPITTNSFRRRNGGIFVGSFSHPPNWDAVQILCQVAPGIASFDPSFVMHIVGSHEPPAMILKLMSDEPSVQFHGWLDDADLKALYSKVLVAITPLMVGAGVKGKVCSAYLNRIPVIGTNISIEGLGLRDKESVLTAVTVQDFITHYINLRRSPHLWENLIRNGLDQLYKQVSVSAARTSLVNVLSSL